MVVLVDTHRLVTQLENDYGFSKQQAEGIKCAIEEFDLDHLATKQDIEANIDKLRAELFKWLVPLLIGQAVLFAAMDKFLS